MSSPQVSAALASVSAVTAVTQSQPHLLTDQQIQHHLQHETTNALPSPTSLLTASDMAGTATAAEFDPSQVMLGEHDHALLDAHDLSMVDATRGDGDAERLSLDVTGATAADMADSDYNIEQHLRQPRRGPNNTTSMPKPPPGSPEWHRMRRDMHKEVERRRRDGINQGITELAKIVPGCERAKGSILARAVQYIQQLRETSSANIDKWTLEKLLTDRAIDNLSMQLANLQREKELLQLRVTELETQLATSTDGEETVAAGTTGTAGDKGLSNDGR